MNDRESLVEATKRKAREGSFAAEMGRAAAGEVASNADDEIEDCGAYGFLRVRERAVHLEFRLKRRAWPAPGYAWLLKPVYDPDGTITLHYASGDSVTIRGRNLRPVFLHILRHQLLWIEEQGQEWQSRGADGLTAVYAIDYQNAEEEPLP